MCDIKSVLASQDIKNLRVAISDLKGNKLDDKAREIASILDQELTKSLMQLFVKNLNIAEDLKAAVATLFSSGCAPRRALIILAEEPSSLNESEYEILNRILVEWSHEKRDRSRTDSTSFNKAPVTEEELKAEEVITIAKQRITPMQTAVDTKYTPMQTAAVDNKKNKPSNSGGCNIPCLIS